MDAPGARRTGRRSRPGNRGRRAVPVELSPLDGRQATDPVRAPTNSPCRDAALTEAQLESLLALPSDEAVLVQHWTLGSDDLSVIGRRRRDRNQLGFAIQLCALRYPGRLLRPGELIPDKALRFVAEQIGTEPEALIAYAARFQTRYEAQ